VFQKKLHSVIGINPNGTLVFDGSVRVSPAPISLTQGAPPVPGVAESIGTPPRAEKPLTFKSKFQPLPPSDSVDQWRNSDFVDPEAEAEDDEVRRLLCDSFRELSCRDSSPAASGSGVFSCPVSDEQEANATLAGTAPVPDVPLVGSSACCAKANSDPGGGRMSSSLNKQDEQKTHAESEIGH